MTSPSSWPDGDLVSIAWHAVVSYGGTWSRLREIDPDLEVGEIEALLDEVRKAGNPVGPDTPRHLAHRLASPHADRLGDLVAAVRAAVLGAYPDADALADRIWATSGHPRVYMSLPAPDLAAPDEVEFLHLGDLPPRSLDWQHRHRVADYPGIRVLTLFNAQLGRHPFDIDLARLDQLRCLDLRENGFGSAPDEVLDCPSLVSLDLSGNPVTDLTNLERLPALSYLGLHSTDVDPAAVARLVRRRPGLVVQT